MNAALKRDTPTYDAAYVGGILRACVQQYDQWRTFNGAFRRMDRFLQRRIPEGQQILDIRTRVNIELHDAKAIIYLPWPDPGEVAEAAAISLSKITGTAFEMTYQGDADGMRDASSARARVAATGREFVLSVWGAKVPGPELGTPERDGTHVMLSEPTEGVSSL